MITYIEKKETVVVLDGKRVGTIKKGSGGYQYYPDRSKKCGEVFKNLSNLKKSLEDI